MLEKGTSTFPNNLQLSEQEKNLKNMSKILPFFNFLETLSMMNKRIVK
jgi:hypothetical protein